MLKWSNDESQATVTFARGSSCPTLAMLKLQLVKQRVLSQLPYILAVSQQKKPSYFTRVKRFAQLTDPIARPWHPGEEEFQTTL